MINIKLYKWFENLDFDKKRYMLEILKFISKRKLVSQNDLFEIPGMKFKYIDSGWKCELILRYWSEKNKMLFYSIAVDGHYILNKLNYDTIIELDSSIKKFESIYNIHHPEKQLDLSDLVIVRTNDVMLQYEIKSAFELLSNCLDDEVDSSISSIYGIK